MSSTLASAGAIDALTDEQRVAAASPAKNVYIEAGPGTGKTTVSAQRFGVQRFAPEHRHDDRSVVAVSFTRAATNNLRQRVQRLWGPNALTWPHRIVTLDTVISDLLHDLLRTGLLVWPNTAELWPGHPITLDVHDSWTSFGKTTWDNTVYALTVVGHDITIHRRVVRQNKTRVPADIAIAKLNQGTCTHQDIRDVLEQALRDPTCSTHIRLRLAETMRTLIVDEVFDADDLDIAIIEAAINAGVAVTLVGDPWQALYLFRGARPHLVPDLLNRTQVRTLQLTESFRWRAETQRNLALNLRSGQGVALPSVHPSDDHEELDVVLALWWKPLWQLTGVLPLAFHSFKGGYEEAAATLLLNHVTRSIFDLDATYLNDALTALAISDRDVVRRLESDFQQVVETLRPGDNLSIKDAYLRLVEAVRTVSPRELRPPRSAHTGRLALIQQRLAYPGRLVPGLTTHQAKGGEWDTVGVHLADSERAALAGGLSKDVDTDRKLYVAGTRARRRTVELVAET